ncbi:protein-L-isoaspartate(D-aspartate) O-methyltransferase [Paraburkholderia rhynchosiae]|uniref:Protein-L-isoaspartate O-methyltransferase n=1 Tax=Paraburkholderia rhynchosiae TaxID=487049 RepID=A0A2N7WHQ1_9BURK|nr:protein-L-isoaspartate(D-aspartate) O-methyltransferase [Paraburkholderia rhynchosiae]PMS28903.1 protein-L-isoaspartate O-methyltransferase [Paraburkholderia rhynchosiae]CAB3665947.1 Protein-L-isoaspartate O-methyltransferase [Paraburkholderia rhynchosiae]
MTSERAKRFPLGLEDLVREPRRPEGRPGEVRAAALAANAALNARQQPAKNLKPGSPGKTPAKQGSAQTQTLAKVSANAQAKPQIIAPPKPLAAPAAKAPARPVVQSASARPVSPQKTSTSASTSVPTAAPPSTRTSTPARTVDKSAPQSASSAKPASRSNERSAAPNVALNGAMALTSERVRERMVERLRANGVTDQRVLNAMSVVPRHMFVDPGLAVQAYEDAALPIGHHQTISKPSVVARMIELAAAGRALNNVLEIGTGCGYQAAVLSQVAREVYSIERIKPLSERAKTNLRPLRIPNIRLHYGDGRLGLPSAAPFDAILIAAAGLDVPQALLEQLAIGGRLVAPVGSQEGQSQVLTLVERLGPAQWRESRLDRVFFVPLKSGVI